IAHFSGRGPTLDNRLKPDFCLPGSEIKMPLSNDIRINVTGTSIAAAIGVGLIALIKEYNPKATFSKIYELLKNSCRDLNLDKFSQGYGIPNITNILKDQGLIHEKILPYNYLIKKSIKMAIEFAIIFIILFYLINFFRIT
ncbi:MAG: S8 family serine peptidase, partial [Candidatus Thorarchaeota archaeon]